MNVILISTKSPDSKTNMHNVITKSILFFSLQYVPVVDPELL